MGQQPSTHDERPPGGEQRPQGGDGGLETCAHCGARIPAGAFCGNCGAHTTEDGARARRFAYAAAPAEHVTRTALITTLFPHLPHRQVHAFREAFIAGLAVTVLLAAFRLFAPAVLAATLLLPVLYLLYLFESEVYEDEPLVVVAATFLAGGALGYVYSVISGHLVTQGFGGAQTSVFTAGVVLPVVAQVLMLAGPLTLVRREKFDEVLDGLTFGAASALGFTLVAVVAASWTVLTADLVNGVAVDDSLRIIRAGVLAAIVNAGTTGLITSALWLRAHGRARGYHDARMRTLGGAVAAGLAVQVGLGLATYYIPELLGVVLAWGVAAAVLLVAVRVVVHFGLLEEGAEHAVGPLAMCTECHRMVPSMLFCPHCGAARSATPKRTRQPLPGRPR